MSEDMISNAEAFAVGYMETGAVKFCDGSDAVLSLLESLNFAPQDEIVVSANVLCQISDFVSNFAVKTVFSDITADRFSPDVSDIVSKLTDKTKAVVISHSFGELAAIDVIAERLKEKNITVIEECVNTLGAVRFGTECIYRAGSFGFGCVVEPDFSFIASKSGYFPEKFQPVADEKAAESFLKRQPDIETKNGRQRLAAAHWQQLIFEQGLLKYVTPREQDKTSCGNACCYPLRAKNRDSLAEYLVSRDVRCKVPHFAFENTGCVNFEKLRRELLLLPTDEDDYEKQQQTILKIKDFYRGQTAD